MDPDEKSIQSCKEQRHCNRSRSADNRKRPLFRYANATALLIALLLALPLTAEGQQSAEEVFGKWLTWQRVERYVDFSDLTRRDNLKQARQSYLLTPDSLLPQLSFFGLPPEFQDAPDEDEAQRLANGLNRFYQLSTSNLPRLLRELEDSGFAGESIEKIERDSDSSFLTQKYRHFFDWLVNGESERRQVSLLFSLASHFFDYCFASRHWQNCESMMETPERRPMARMIYTLIWYQLSGNGWRYWHEETLNALRKESEAGREVVYIAGGTDLFQLLEHGIFRIRIIDPIFPSQTRFYSEGWEYLTRGEGEDGGIGDRIIFGPQRQQQLIMQRSSFELGEEFTTDILSDGSRHRLHESTTEWEIFDVNGKKLGYYTLERRFVRQNDFQLDPKRVFLVSFNELYYITHADPGGWGIDPNLFDRRFSIYVKQLPRPVDRTTALRLYQASNNDFSYIRLGTSVD